MCYGYRMVPTRPHQDPVQGVGRTGVDRSLSFCATHELITTIGDRWSVLVLFELGDHGELRSGVLRRALSGVSQKVLTDCLRRLERRGFVTRTTIATMPVTVSYRLTEFGCSFFEAIRPLRQWANDHTDQLEKEPVQG